MIFGMEESATESLVFVIVSNVKALTHSPISCLFASTSSGAHSAFSVLRVICRSSSTSDSSTSISSPEKPKLNVIVRAMLIDVQFARSNRTDLRLCSADRVDSVSIFPMGSKQNMQGMQVNIIGSDSQAEMLAY